MGRSVVGGEAGPVRSGPRRRPPVRVQGVQSHRRWFGPLLLGALVVLAAGCGGDDREGGDRAVCDTAREAEELVFPEQFDPEVMADPEALFADVQQRLGEVEDLATGAETAEIAERAADVGRLAATTEDFVAFGDFGGSDLDVALDGLLDTCAATRPG